MAKKSRKNLTKIFLWLFILALLVVAIPVGINDWVIQSTASRIVTAEKATALQDVECTIFGIRLINSNFAVGTLGILFAIGFVLFCKADRLNQM